jgi:hypothetical protein
MATESLRQRWLRPPEDGANCIETCRGNNTITTYEGRLISNAHSEISRTINNAFKQAKRGTSVRYFSYNSHTYFST